MADAWRGRDIRACVDSFLQASTGGQTLEIVFQHAGRPDRVLGGSGADLLVYLGHNGLMEFPPPAVRHASGRKPDVVVLCCKSRNHFEPLLRGAGARPVLLTTQLMYPGAFILREILPAWCRNAPGEEIRLAAARAYARNQKISTKSATGVFHAD